MRNVDYEYTYNSYNTEKYKKKKKNVYLIFMHFCVVEYCIVSNMLMPNSIEINCELSLLLFASYLECFKLITQVPF